MLDIEQIVREHNTALVDDLIDLLDSRLSAQTEDFAFFGDLDEAPGDTPELAARRAQSRRMASAIRAQRLMLPTLAAAYHPSREPLLLKIEARLGEGEQDATITWLWVRPDGACALTAQDCRTALEWAWQEGYRRADEEVWTFNRASRPLAIGGGAWYTPVEAAALTGTSESGWRNRAAAGKIAGAIKKGKQWLIPANAVTGA